MLAPIMSWMDEPKAPASPAQTVMFGTCLEAATTRAVEPSGSLEDVRIRRANRSQVVMGPTDLDSQLPADDSARAIWAVVERLDLSALYAQIISRRGSAGAPAIDPKILLSLWIYAVSEGETSAREIERQTKKNISYRWLCGEVSVNYHTLSDFRVKQRKVIDDLITQVLALLMKRNLVELKRIAQDGTRVRANAGAASFRTQASLDEMMREAREHLDSVTADSAQPGWNERRRASQVRAAKDRIQRLEEALAELPEIEATKKRSGAKDTEPRVSTTDPEARVMKMGDGGFRPAYNVQFGTTTDAARVIVGVNVTNRGSDMAEAAPMVAQVEARTGVRPDELLVDGGYVGHASIDAVADQGVTVYGPVPRPRGGAPEQRFVARADDSEAVAQWRQRMSTDEAKRIYKLRGSTAETVNADAKCKRGLSRISVVGKDKALGVALLFALTYNVLRALSLGAFA